MTFLLIALLVAFAAAAGIVLADSGLRMWSAFGGIAAQRAMLRSGAGLPTLRGRRARVVTRVSYARPAFAQTGDCSSGLCQPVNRIAPLRAAA